MNIHGYLNDEFYHAVLEITDLNLSVLLTIRKRARPRVESMSLNVDPTYKNIFILITVN